MSPWQALKFWVPVQGWFGVVLAQYADSIQIAAMIVAALGTALVIVDLAFGVSRATPVAAGIAYVALVVASAGAYIALIWAIMRGYAPYASFPDGGPYIVCTVGALAAATLPPLYDPRDPISGAARA